MVMYSFNDQAQNCAVTENRIARNCICAMKHTGKLLVSEVEKGRSIWIATKQDIEGYMVYDHIRKHSHV